MFFQEKYQGHVLSLYTSSSDADDCIASMKSNTPGVARWTDFMSI